MKKLLLLASVIGLIGCMEDITDEDVAKAQYSETFNAADNYLSKYNQKGGNDKVYQNFEVDGKYFSVDDVIQSVMFKCSSYIPVEKSDVEKYEDRLRGDVNYWIKEGVVVDYQQFDQCLDKQLDKTGLNYKNLMIFSNDPDVQKYKEADQAITKLINQAKSDGEISYFEALNIYMAVHTQREKDLFNKI